MGDRLPDGGALQTVRPERNRKMLTDSTNKGGQISILDFFRKYPALIILAAVALIADTSYMTMIPLVPLYFRDHFQVRHDILIGFAISALPKAAQWM